MFNDDFYELKKALENVTIEVTDLKNKLHQKDIEVNNLQLAKNRAEQMLRDNNSTELREKNVEQDINIRELTLSNNQAHTKNIQLRGEIQSLTDRLAGLVKENDNLKREAIASKLVTKAFGNVKSFVGNLKNS
jgi:predicted  nucleic acid-binding Zn-ribbon protein